MGQNSYILPTAIAEKILDTKYGFDKIDGERACALLARETDASPGSLLEQRQEDHIHTVGGDEAAADA